MYILYYRHNTIRECNAVHITQGRSVESGNFSWTCCRWDFEYEILFMDWGEEKKADHKLMNFCGDAEEFRIRFNVVMAL